MRREPHMPHVGRTEQVKRKGDKSGADIRKTFRDAIPRDNLRTAFGGDQNKGPAGTVRKAGHGDTHVKSRRLQKGSGKTPKR